MRKEAKAAMKTLTAKLYRDKEEKVIDQMHQFAQTSDLDEDKAMIDPANVPWVNTWKALSGGDGHEAALTQEELTDAYVIAYVAQSKVDLWDERDALQRKEDEAEPMPIQFRNLGGSDAPLHAPRL